MAEKFSNTAIEMVVSEIHYFLLMIEQNEEYDILKYADAKSQFINLRDTSDGLCGELYTEDIWTGK